MAEHARLPFDLLAVDRDSDVPMHRQIYVALRGYILDGRVSAAVGLPSTRALAQDLNVGRNTVIAAYDQLLAEGYIEARAGSGTWVAPRLAAPAPQQKPAALRGRLSRRGELIAARPQPARRPGMINLHAGVPETATFPFSLWTRLLARNSRSRDEALLGYHGFGGHAGLRQSIAAYLRVARGIECRAEEVIIVTGAQAALDLSARILMDDGDCAWMEEPGYLGARSALLAGGARLAPLRVDRQGWNFVDPALPPPRLIYVTPSCQWPFGTIMRIDERLRLLALAEQHKAWLIEDDYDGEYRLRGRPVPALRGLDGSGRVIYIGTFGKTLFPSLRIGYLVVPPELSEAFGQAVSISGQFPPMVLQATANDFLKGGYFASHLKRMRRLYAQRQARFVNLCGELLGEWLSIAENESGMQLFGSFRKPLDDQAVAAAALAEGVEVLPASLNYHFDAPEQGLLLGYAALDDKRMGDALRALRAAFLRVDGPGTRRA